MKKSEAFLTIANVDKHFGGITALNGCSFKVMKKSITGLIGPNGSGKTTLFNVIGGIYKPDKGIVNFNSKKIDGLKPYQIVGEGIVRTFQITRIFPEMTVLENLKVAPQHQLGEKLLYGLLKTASVKEQEKEIEKRAIDLLNFVGLSKLKDENGRNLSFGQQKLLELTRALMSEPQLLLLDEPFAGVNLTMVKYLIELILELRQKQGKTILIIEHNIRALMTLVDKVVVLNLGEKIAEGTPKEIQENERVIEAYLGV